MTSPSLDIPPPGPGFVATVAASTGIRRADDYDIAQLLITHPGPRRPNETIATVEDGMRRLATALRLGPGNQAPPVIGAQLMIRRGAVALDYGHDQYVMTIPSPQQDWLALVRHGGLCRICLLIAPLTLTTTTAETYACLYDGAKTGKVMWGTTFARRRS